MSLYLIFTKDYLPFTLGLDSRTSAPPLKPSPPFFLFLYEMVKKTLHSNKIERSFTFTRSIFRLKRNLVRISPLSLFYWLGWGLILGAWLKLDAWGIRGGSLDAARAQRWKAVSGVITKSLDSWLTILYKRFSSLA